MKLVQLFLVLAVCHADLPSQSATFIETTNPGIQRNDDDPCFLYETSSPGLTFGTLTITELCCTDKSQPTDGSLNSNIGRDDWYELYANRDVDHNPGLDCELRFVDATEPETFFDTIFVYQYGLKSGGGRQTLSDPITQKLTADPIPPQLNIFAPAPTSTGDLGDDFDASLAHVAVPRLITVNVFGEVLVRKQAQAVADGAPSGFFLETTETGEQVNDGDPCFIWKRDGPGVDLEDLKITELCCTDKSVPTDGNVGANIERDDWFELFQGEDDGLHIPGLDCEVRFEDPTIPGPGFDTIFVYQYPVGDDGARITFGSGITPDVLVTQKLTSDPIPAQLNIFGPPPTSTGELGNGFDGSDDSSRTIAINIHGAQNVERVTPAAPTGSFIESEVHGVQVNDGDDCFIFDLHNAGLSFGGLAITDLCCADKSNPVDGSQNHGISRDEWFTLYQSTDEVNNPAMDCEVRFEDYGDETDTIFVFQFPLSKSGGRFTLSPATPQKLTTDPIPLQLNIFSPPPEATGDLGTFFNDVAQKDPKLMRLVNVQITGAREIEEVTVDCGSCLAPSYWRRGCDVKEIQDCVCRFDSYCCYSKWDAICVSEVPRCNSDCVKAPSDDPIIGPTGGFTETQKPGVQRNDGDPCQIYDLSTKGVTLDTLRATEMCCTDKSIPVDGSPNSNIERDDWFQLFKSDDTHHNPGLDCELRFTDDDLPGESFDTIFVYQYPLGKDGVRITTGSGFTADVPVTQKLTMDPIPIQLNVFAPPPTSTGDLGDGFDGTDEAAFRDIFVIVTSGEDIKEIEEANAGGGSNVPVIVAVLIGLAIGVMVISVLVWHFKYRSKKEQGIDMQYLNFEETAA